MWTPDNNPNARWFALQTRQRHEKIVSTFLRHKGYSEFLPLYRARRVWSDRIAAVELPLFPGYIFCRFDLNDRRVPIVSTPGVIRVVGVGRDPYPVSASEMDAIHTIIESGLPAEPWPYLQSGTPVRIRYGALSGTEGLLVETKSSHRLVVSVSLLQRSIGVEIDSAWVVPLAANWRPGALPLGVVPATL